METPLEHPRFVTMTYFWKEMLGMESRGWFYSHQHDPGFPQRVMVGDRPMLVYDECVEYMKRLIAERDKGTAPARKRGRPRKLPDYGEPTNVR